MQSQNVAGFREDPSQLLISSQCLRLSLIQKICYRKIISKQKKLKNQPVLSSKSCNIQISNSDSGGVKLNYLILKVDFEGFEGIYKDFHISHDIRINNRAKTKFFGCGKPRSVKYPHLLQERRFSTFTCSQKQNSDLKNQI